MPEGLARPCGEASREWLVRDVAPSAEDGHLVVYTLDITVRVRSPTHAKSLRSDGSESGFGQMHRPPVDTPRHGPTGDEAPADFCDAGTADADSGQPRSPPSPVPAPEGLLVLFDAADAPADRGQRIGASGQGPYHPSRARSSLTRGSLPCKGRLRRLGYQCCWR